MNQDVYMIIADLMRYVFFLIVAFILLRLFVLSLREWRAGAVTKRRRRSVQVGYITIIKPNSLSGERYRLYREATVGKSRSCDIPLPVKSIKRRHAIIFERGGDMYITACYPSRCTVSVNGEPIGRGDGKLADGYTVETEGVSFRVHIEEADELTEEDENIPEEYTDEYDDDNWEESANCFDDDETEAKDPFDDDWYEA